MKPLLRTRTRRRATVLLMIVGLLAMLFILVTAFIVMAQHDRITQNLAADGERVGDIINSLDDLVIDRLRGSDPNMVGVGGMDYLQLPGFHGGSYVAGADIIRDPNGSVNDPNSYFYTPSSLIQKRWSAARRLPSLFVRTDVLHPLNPLWSPSASFDPGLAANLNMVSNLQQPLWDATGTGFPNASFAGSAWATELANGMVGMPVQVTSPDPNSLAGLDLSTLTYNPALPYSPTNFPYYAWQTFAGSARYSVAMKVVPHGGMLQLALDPRTGLIRPWNTFFVEQMFAELKRSSDGNRLDPLGNPGDLQLLQQMAAQSPAIEPLLRRRDGLLDVPNIGTNPVQPIPAALATLQAAFPYTLSPQTRWQQQSMRTVPWERFNLTDLNEWGVWRQAMTLDPVTYLTRYNQGPSIPLDNLARRRMLTTVNNSDDLAWVQSPKNATWDLSHAAGGALGLKPGALKFFLGRITDLTVAPNDLTGIPRGAFRFEPSVGYVFNDDQPNGTGAVPGLQILHDLADYYYEMLAPFKNGVTHGWGVDDSTDDPAHPQANNTQQCVSRWRQACMLAVNTVAFAAPRLKETAGGGSYFDTIRFPDPRNTVSGSRIIYYGYTPQPFITRVMAYNNPENPGQPNADPRVALLVELFNPYDSDTAGESMPQDLDLSHYALSVNDGYDPTQPVPDLTELGPLAAGIVLPGRTYQIFSISDRAKNPYFEQTGGYGGNPNARPVPVGDGSSGPQVPYPGNGATLVVKLWHIGNHATKGFPHLVDQFELKTTNPDFHFDREEYLYAARDTSYEPYLGRFPAAPSLTGAARWRMVVAATKNDPTNMYSMHAPVDGTPSPQDLWDFRRDLDTDPNSLIPSNTPAYTPTSPAVPLYTMNPNLVDPVSGLRTTSIVLHGVARPSAFPHVGFLLFVPRFSHVTNFDAASDKLKPMTSVLYEQWRDLGYGMTGQRPPVDFGHMPIFDNTQQAADPTTADPGAFVDHVGQNTQQEPRFGATPWGQLVFNYFTTTDPNDPNIDPYRIPGRIDVNAASWYMLSLLPAFGPINAGDPSSSLPFGGTAAAPPGTVPNIPTGAAPAFWSRQSGILAGAGVQFDGVTALNRVPDYLDGTVAVPLNGSGQAYRLHPKLAAAAAEYRDRLAYTPVYPSGDPNWSNESPSPLAGASDRNGAQGQQPLFPPYPPQYREPTTYGSARREQMQDPDAYTALKTGFVSIGELASVPGFDDLVLLATLHPLYFPRHTQYYHDDFMRAVSMLALLDTHFLTVRGNTYTIYVSLIDRQNPQASIRSQVTVDRSNLLPRLMQYTNAGVTSSVTVPSSAVPEVIGKREVSYFNAKYDE